MQIHIDNSDIENMDDRKRKNLINSLSGFKSLNILGSADKDGNTNLAIFNSVFHLGADPALMGCIIRPDSVPRHTLKNILETGYYTINHVNRSIYKQAHQTSARYPENISEFDATGLTPEYKNRFAAPYVKESIVKIGLQFQQRIDIELNHTILLIGKVNEVFIPRDCWYEDGFLNIEKAGTLTGIGLDSYHTTQTIDRLSYAKPDQPLNSIHSVYLD
jgi:flavin reductase (DIM6/NTAB) family NADH-FMN oxidoreductase RutF